MSASFDTTSCGSPAVRGSLSLNQPPQSPDAPSVAGPAGKGQGPPQRAQSDQPSPLPVSSTPPLPPTPPTAGGVVESNTNLTLSTTDGLAQLLRHRTSIAASVAKAPIPKKYEAELEAAKLMVTEQQRKREIMLYSQRLRLRKILPVLLAAIVYATFTNLWRVCFGQGIRSMAPIIMDWVLDTLWWLWIVRYSVMPFERGGTWITETKQVWIHALVTEWVWLDILGAVPIELAPLILGWDYRNDIGGSGWFHPLWRCNRLLHLHHFASYLTKFFNSLEYDYEVSLMRGIRFIVLITITIHLSACLYFCVGTSFHAEYTNWFFDPDFQTYGAVHQYFQCVYWSTNALFFSHVKQPVTDGQAVFSLIVVAVGVLLYAVLIGFLTSLILSLDSGNNALRAKLDLATDYMSLKQFPEDFQQEIRTYYRTLWDTTRTFTNNDMLLDELPDQLKQRLIFATNLDTLKQIPLFKCVAEHTGFLHELCAAANPRAFVVDSVLVDTQSTCMYVIQSGECSVLSQYGNAIATLSSGDWFGESALILNHAKVPTIIASTYVTVFTISRYDLINAGALFPDALCAITSTVHKYKQRLKKKSKRLKEKAKTLASIQPLLQSRIVEDPEVFHHSDFLPDPNQDNQEISMSKMDSVGNVKMYDKPTVSHNVFAILRSKLHEKRQANKLYTVRNESGSGSSNNVGVVQLPEEVNNFVQYTPTWQDLTMFAVQAVSDLHKDDTKDEVQSIVTPATDPPPHRSASFLGTHTITVPEISMESPSMLVNSESIRTTTGDILNTNAGASVVPYDEVTTPTSADYLGSQHQQQQQQQQQQPQQPGITAPTTTILSNNTNSFASGIPDLQSSTVSTIPLSPEVPLPVGGDTLPPPSYASLNMRQSYSHSAALRAGNSINNNNWSTKKSPSRHLIGKPNFHRLSFMSDRSGTSTILPPSPYHNQPSSASFLRRRSEYSTKSSVTQLSGTNTREFTDIALRAQLPLAEGGLEIKPRWYLLKQYPPCFVGKQAVDWLLDNFLELVDTREDAELYLNRMLLNGVIEHVTGVHLFQDKEYFYKFTSGYYKKQATIGVDDALSKFESEVTAFDDLLESDGGSETQSLTENDTATTDMAPPDSATTPTNSTSMYTKQTVPSSTNFSATASYNFDLPSPQQPTASRRQLQFAQDSSRSGLNQGRSVHMNANTSFSCQSLGLSLHASSAAFVENALSRNKTLGNFIWDSDSSGGDSSGTEENEQSMSM